MIPKSIEALLHAKLPQGAWENRLIKEGAKCYVEFTSADVERLSRLNIEVDPLGPQLVVVMWDEESALEVGGYLVVDNLAMGKPSMGGIRMLNGDAVTPAAIHNLARGMTLKNAAANLPYGGGKSGIVADKEFTAAEHTEVVRRFARLIFRYREIYLPGPDVGTNDADMKTIAIENGIDHTLSKPVEMGGNRIDQLGAAGGGTVIALQALLAELPKLRALPQFKQLHLPAEEEITVIIQGFGAVGAHAARVLRERLPKAKVVGVSDAVGYLYDENGLPFEKLFKLWQEQGVVTRPYFLATLNEKGSKLKYGTQPNDLLRENAFACIPAAPMPNYLDTDEASHPSMTVDRMGRWQVSIEGANTYSPDPARKAARARMERAVYRERGVLIATDYLVNSGGVIFAAHEQLIKTPKNLRFPNEILGQRDAVEKWLQDHAAEFTALAEQRRVAADKYREEVIRRNMHELVELLSANPEMLPREASEQISVRRITARESGRTAADLMIAIPTMQPQRTIKEAAAKLVEAKSPMLAVVAEQGALAGVLTEWDITRAAAQGVVLEKQAIEQIMTREVIAALPSDGITELLRKFEYHEISAMPIVDGDMVQGMISAEVLAQKTLARLLQSQT